LPWAIIRLIQRVGRVDRIGQENTIYCYCFLPEEGINKVIDLRGRLQARLQENAELIGSDEQFFEGDRVNLQHAYDEQLDLDGEDETDLISRCYAIWLQATKNDDALRKKIEALPDVVYSAKALPAKESSASGLLAYIKTSHQQHILVRMDERGEVVSHSQSKILDLLACEKDERQATPAANHFDLLQRAVAHVRSDEAGSVGGALGGPRSVRNRVYSGIKRALERHQGTLFESPPIELKEALQLIYRWPLKETARDRLGRQLRAGISDQDLAQMVQDLWQANDLCMVSKSDEPPEPRIVCSMGLCAAPRLPGGGEPCDNAGGATQDRRPRSPPGAPQ
ncbi:MAG: NgoFVII family restriction endonuclease, partial [Gammaproteobacteria bacterium]|nr:NgoFVII family restriction endonuclease [Gammaproteobacteria bacterium]